MILIREIVLSSFSCVNFIASPELFQLAGSMTQSYLYKIIMSISQSVSEWVCSYINSVTKITALTTLHS